MKKTLLLSVVASTMIMAGGDIAPVEPVVEAPVAASAWNFEGQGVVYYETFGGDGDSLFDQESSAANAGLSLKATNDDLIAGIGFGAKLNGLGTLGLEEDVVSEVMQNANGELNSAYLSELYLTYGFDNTSIKIGRQELPKALSPFAFSENWNVFSNTFNAALVVNTDLQDTVLVGAWVRDNNVNAFGADMNVFASSNEDRGLFLLTAQNKSIENLTLTGSWYYGSEYGNGQDDLNILWADAQYKMGDFNIAAQGGSVMHDDLDDTKAFGAKVDSTFGMVNASLAYSNVNDSDLGMFQIGGTTSALYTNMLVNQLIPFLDIDNDKYVVNANADVLAGNLSAAYGYTDFGTGEEIKEFDVAYTAKINDNINVLAAYANIDLDGETLETIRIWGRYNF